MEIVTDERGGLTVMRDGHPQSYVDLDDPELLVFEYIQHLALVIDAMPAGPLRVTHIGGAGLTLPRYINHTRPESPQIVMEPDEALTALVRRDARCLSVTGSGCAHRPERKGCPSWLTARQMPSSLMRLLTASCPPIC